MGGGGELIVKEWLALSSRSASGGRLALNGDELSGLGRDGV